MSGLLNFILSALAIFVTGYILPGVEVGGMGSIIAIVIIMAAVNAFIRPVVSFLAIPINILTLGLFSFVINALMVLLVAMIVPSFEVAGFWSALIFSLALSVVQMIVFSIFKK